MGEQNLNEAAAIDAAEYDHRVGSADCVCGRKARKSGLDSRRDGTKLQRWHCPHCGRNWRTVRE